jgi:predicted acyltransferase
MNDSNAAQPSGPLPGRLMSLDVFRGATIAAMILVNNPGSGAIYGPLKHADWHGWTFTDTVFPFFLWIVGVAIPLSVSRRLAAGQSRRELFLHGLRRAAIIFALGLFLNSLSYLLNGSLFRLGLSEWLHTYLTNVRIPGVLQRIAVCYLAALVIFLRHDWRGQIRWLGVLLFGYWALMAWAPFPVNVHGEWRYVSGLWEKGDNFAAYVDNLVFNGPRIGTHVWSVAKTWDPEGVVSTIPAIATCLFGVLAGQWLRTPRSEAEKTAWLMVVSALLMWAGQLWNFWVPINKPLWTSSYSVFMAGLAGLCMGVWYWLVDVQGWRKPFKPLAIYGMNAIAMFVLAGVLGRVLLEFKVTGADGAPVSLKAWLFQTCFARLGNPETSPLPSGLARPENASLLWAVAFVSLLYLVAWGMYRKRWFIKF